jgi:hypothetical protein
MKSTRRTDCLLVRISIMCLILLGPRCAMAADDAIAGRVAEMRARLALNEPNSGEAFSKAYSAYLLKVEAIRTQKANLLKEEPRGDAGAAAHRIHMLLIRETLVAKELHEALRQSLPASALLTFYRAQAATEADAARSAPQPSSRPTPGTSSR